MSEEPACLYTGHARERMRQRHISEEDVEDIIENWVERRAARPRRGAVPSEILVGHIRGRQLHVYVEVGSHPPLVKTAAWA